MVETTRYSVGMDLGTTKLAIAQVQQTGSNPPELIGFSQHPCRFLKNGLITNLDPLIEAVNHCLSEIRSLSHMPVRQVVINCTTGNIYPEHNEGWIEFPKRREILTKHLGEVHRKAQNEDQQKGRVLIHETPEQYCVDDQSDIDSPIGMMGHKLGVRMRQIYAEEIDIRNLVHSIAKCGLRVSHVVAEPYALTESLLTQDDQAFEFWLIDIGGKHTQLAVMDGSAITPLPLLQLGGDIITSDISIALKTPVKEAERIKIKHGCARSDLAQDSLIIQIPGLGGMAPATSISQQLLTQIIQPRVDEIFEEIARSFQSLSRRSQRFAGIVMSGGTSDLAGIREHAEAQFQTRVIPGSLRDIGGLKDIAPCSASALAVGLAIYGLRHPRQEFPIPQSRFSFMDGLKRCFNWFGGGSDL